MPLRTRLPVLLLLLLAAAPAATADLRSEVEGRIIVGDLEGGLELLQAAERAGPERYLLLAEILNHEDPPPVDRIETALREAFRLDTGSPAPLIRLGTVLRDAGELDAAERLLYEGLEIFPDHPNLLQVLGTVRSRRGETGPGARLLQKAASLAPEDRGIARDLGLVNVAAGFHGQALRLLAEARDRAPDDLEVRRALAEVYRAVQDPRHALPEEQAVVRLEALRDHRRIRWRALRVLSQRIAGLEELAAGDDPPTGTFVELHRLYEERHDPDWSFPRLERFAAMHPESLEARGAVGLVESSGRDPDAAPATLRAVLAEDPANPLALEGCLRLHGNPFDAAALQTITETAVAADPGAAASHYYRGRALGIAGRVDSAVAAYRRALELQPDLGRASIELAALLRARDEAAAAEATLERAVAEDPASPEVALTFGLEAMIRGDTDVAVARLIHAHDLGARHPRLLRSLGDLAMRRGDPTSAIAFYREALVENPDQPDLQDLMDGASR